MDEVKQLIQREQTKSESKMQREANFIIALCKDLAAGAEIFHISEYSETHEIPWERCALLMREVLRIKDVKFFNATNDRMEVVK